jgi:acetyl esterase/lipase
MSSLSSGPDDPSISTTITQSVLERLDSEYCEFLLSLPPSSRRPLHNLTWSSAFRGAAKDEPPELGEALGVPVGSTQVVELGGFSAKVLTPDGDKPKCGWPVLIWAHGGGWVFGSAESGVSTYSRACVGECAFLGQPESRTLKHVWYPTYRGSVCSSISRL